MSAITTLAPSAARHWQCCRPSRPEPPVTTATRRLRSNGWDTMGSPVKSAGLAKSRFQKLAAHTRAQGALSGGLLELGKHRAIGAQQVGDVLLVVRKAQVVKTRPEHAA